MLNGLSNRILRFFRGVLAIDLMQKQIDELKDDVRYLNRRIDNLETRIDQVYDVVIDILDHVKGNRKA